jgi:hypothetical protein
MVKRNDGTLLSKRYLDTRVQFYKVKDYPLLDVPFLLGCLKLYLDY